MLYKVFLENAGHSVPLIAHNRQEALDAISKFDEHHINVAVLDKNLDSEDEYNVESSSKLAEMVTKP